MSAQNLNPVQNLAPAQKLWLLTPSEKYVIPSWEEDNNPWWPCFDDKVLAFVVRAASEEEARQLANAKAGLEDFAGLRLPDRHVWLDPAFTLCEELTSHGEPGIIVRHCPES